MNNLQGAFKDGPRAQPVEGETLLKIDGLNKTFKQAGNTLEVLQNLSMRIAAGEIVALVGPSGSGKSTLMQIAGLLDSPTSGKIFINGHQTEKMGDAARTKLRLDYIGFVYQFHHLLPEFTAVENVGLPQIIAGKPKKVAHKKAGELLTSLGLGERLTHRPGKLSGGEQQRVAIARALANDPTLLFADEPTGNLDLKTSEEVFEILMQQVRQRGIGALIATHNMELAEQMDRVLELKAGRIVPF
ncbi:MAG: lipoprotein-releasing system ATP-binding protein LolD 1 [Micavibrio sp.]|nr:MAG: lipoprotein-releasing system ATP-binding protein LolD 1 [Micavibrio sp.]